ncbi:MAG: hypothetical protein ACYST2_06205 [Planctomycetota bacterium]|jgi:hypothetical protein
MHTLPLKGEAVAKFVVLYFLILGAAIVTALLIMLACGWRPDLNQERKAWKGASPIIWQFIFSLLFSLPLCKIAGLNYRNAVLIAVCLACLVVGAVWFWAHRKRSRDTKQLDNELLSNLNNKPKE